MLIDEAEIRVKAGNGGQAAQTYRGFRKGVKVGPSGGDGGQGGSIYFIASHDVSDLSIFQFKKDLVAENGKKGMPGNHNGKDGTDLLIPLPIGTRVVNEDEEFDIIDTSTPVLIAKGGDKELGSYSLSKITGEPNIDTRGQEKKLSLNLSLIADIGLIGLPNAGKSSILKKLTNANPKIGNYPFTTLEPNLGVMDELIIADIPGLIEGASEGIGLGTKFLKHIEKTKILVHCISAESIEPNLDYKTVREEFKKYNQALLEKEEIILITKKDLVTQEELDEKIKLLKKEVSTVMSISVFDENSLKQLRNVLNSL